MNFSGEFRSEINIPFNFNQICKFVPNIMWRRFKTLKKNLLSLKNLLRSIRPGLTSIFNSQIKTRSQDSGKLIWNGTQIIFKTLFGICESLKIQNPENEYMCSSKKLLRSVRPGLTSQRSNVFFAHSPCSSHLCNLKHSFQD